MTEVTVNVIPSDEFKRVHALMGTPAVLPETLCFSVPRPDGSIAEAVPFTRVALDPETGEARYSAYV